MAIPLNAEMLAAAYDYLCCQLPFSEWNLPNSEDVIFRVSKKRDRFAHYQFKDGAHHIVFSCRFVGRHDVLIATMAHELIHLHMRASCVSARDPHGPAFQAYGDLVCSIHEFDRLTF